MRTVFRIYKRDVVNVVTNWVALVVIIALMILPALYAWFNIKSAWDPYGNTQGILVAVVNKDKGVEVKGQKLSIGKDLVEKLKTNKNMGWRFVDEKDAEHGIKYGKYYASITIPEDFSAKIGSLTEPNPKKAELIYSVNEKRNAVAPKITQKGVSTIQHEITTTFVETVNGLIFNAFNELGLELSKGKPILKQFMDVLFELDEKIPEINKAVDDVYNQTVTLNNFIDKVQGKLPIIDDTINKTTDVVSKGENFLTKAREGMKNLSPFIKSELVSIANISRSVESLMDEAVSLIETNPKRVREILIIVRDRYAGGVNRLNNLLDFLTSFNKSDNKIVSNLENRIRNLRDRMQEQVDYINSVISAIDKGAAISLEALNTIKKEASSISNFLDNIISDYDGTIAPAIDSIMQNSIAATDNTLKLLQDAHKDLPVVGDILVRAFSGTKVAIEDIASLKEKLPGIEKNIHNIAERLRALNTDESLNELIKILSLNARKESEFIANPVDVKMNRLFPIPNYGSAMSPFFTTLSLWVGGLILVSILSVEVKPFDDGKKIKLHQAFLGRYLTFVTISIFQALIVTLGDLFLLKIYAVNPVVFIGFAIFISIVFTMIIYTLVSVLGNVGKALAMILLVLQISASGGTFPIEVTPPFFQRINPLLPFTYGVGGMREGVGGVLWDLLYQNAAILSIYFILFLVLGLTWQRVFKNIISKFVEQFNKSGLSGE